MKFKPVNNNIAKHIIARCQMHNDKIHYPFKGSSSHYIPPYSIVVMISKVSKKTFLKTAKRILFFNVSVQRIQ